MCQGTSRPFALHRCRCCCHRYHHHYHQYHYHRHNHHHHHRRPCRICAIRAETKLAVKLRLGHASLNPQHKDAYAAGVGGWEKRLSKDAAEAESGTEMAMVSGGAMVTPGGSVLGMA